MFNLLHPDAVVVHAEHGARAWEIISGQDKEFDLFLSDNEMPQMNGVELTEKIRGKYPDAHIVLMSGKLEPEGHKASAFLVKPFLFRTASMTIERVMTEK
jgi:two-component system response regulator YesN